MTQNIQASHAKYGIHEKESAAEHTIKIMFLNDQALVYSADINNYSKLQNLMDHDMNFIVSGYVNCEGDVRVRI